MFFLFLIALWILVAIIAIFSLRKKRKREREYFSQIEGQILSLARETKIHVKNMKNAMSASSCLLEWNLMIDSFQEILKLQKTYRGADSTVDEAFNAIQAERGNLQWDVRNAIERHMNSTIHSIKNVYRNSKEHIAFAYNSFCDDIENSWKFFSGETKEFADKATAKVYAVTGFSGLPRNYEMPPNDGVIRPDITIETGNSDGENGAEVSKGSCPTEQVSVESLMAEIDKMEGHDFEYLCADVLGKTGFDEVRVTKGSGDQGADIIAKRNGVKYAIQCKCYSTNLGNTPVQEINAGKTFYNCHVGAVMTNSYFTQSAIALAEKTGVLLWNRDELKKMLDMAIKKRELKEQGNASGVL